MCELLHYIKVRTIIDISINLKFFCQAVTPVLIFHPVKANPYFQRKKFRCLLYNDKQQEC